ncbi:Bax inhibitor-1/YccA family protein [Saccharophagus degradans]|uniref:Bax inhibitor-1/YccA family protein n=1 Tax=Saccharophagus degradans TaxID=86304 RepID=A0AAW7X4Y6_9GAMM|nr:Bax inhibitor-1/YccA family protein [Saccharophagus degradans]MDO6421706.1 Bax inhibitor-1/YccA family protein [Saccharophagus degradans]MDO6606600.1 Bax inhibitor-1/YccA family protein [Saccharophagus degradans]
MQELYTHAGTQSSTLEVSKVLRNTYALLAMTITFSAAMAVTSMALGVPYLGLWMLLPYIGLLFLVEKTKNSAMGIVSVFALTGWLGFSIGPIISYYIGVSGIEPILTALGGTALTFFVLSGYTLATKKDMSKYTGFLMTGLVVILVAMVANWFLQISALSLTISCAFLFLSSMLIMWQTSEIIHGGERNYISATVTLYVSLYNIFSILLSFLGGSDD